MGDVDTLDETTEEPTADSDEADKQQELQNPDADYPELQRQQNFVTDWSRMLSLKAEAELPGVESQLQAAQTQSTPPNAATPPVNEEDATSAQPDPVAQLEGMKTSMEKAVELGPEVVEHSGAAADSLGSSDMIAALPDQQEALKLLREIAESLQQQNQQRNDEQNGDENQQDQNQQNQNQNQQNQNRDQQESKQNQEQQREQQQQSQQERAMSVLRRARERERQHRDLQKQVRALSGGRINVDRDW